MPSYRCTRSPLLLDGWVFSLFSVFLLLLLLLLLFLFLAYTTLQWTSSGIFSHSGDPWSSQWEERKPKPELEVNLKLSQSSVCRGGGEHEDICGTQESSRCHPCAPQASPREGSYPSPVPSPSTPLLQDKPRAGICWIWTFSPRNPWIMGNTKWFAIISFF